MKNQSSSSFKSHQVLKNAVSPQHVISFPFIGNSPLCSLWKLHRKQVLSMLSPVPPVLHVAQRRVEKWWCPWNWCISLVPNCISRPPLIIEAEESFPFMNRPRNNHKETPYILSGFLINNHNLEISKKVH